MKARISVFLVIGSLAVAVTSWQIGLVSQAAAGDEVVAAAAVAVVPTVTSEYEYVGSSKCKKCHIKSHKSWKKTKMALSLELLKPGQASEAKRKFNLDPAKDYSTDEKCLACHTTGFGKPGGYAVPNPANKKAVKKAKKLAGVGCESCHGPGSAYIKVFDEIMKSKRKYKVEELHAVGLAKIDASTCTTCHNDQGPTFDASKPFDFDAQKDEGLHDHETLEQRD